MNKITKQQRAKLIRVLRYLRNSNQYNGVTSVRVKINTEYEHFISAVFETRRSDCDRYSPRQIMCKQRMHVIIGKRGGMKVCSSDDSLRSNLSHVRRMLNAR